MHIKLNEILKDLMTKKQEMQKTTNLVINCRKCSLWKTRNHPVVGDGSLDAKIMFIGEAPGRNEDLQGKPFVGKAGKILDELLESINLKREDVYIGNILKCRPPNNRNPMKSEIETCTGYLDRQLEIIQPKVICPLGNFACSFIFEKFGLKTEKISGLHGRIFQTNTLFGKITIIPLFHPAVATYNPNTKTVLLEDFQIVKKTIS